MNAVELSHVGFSYGRDKALDDVSLSLGVGVYGLLGPNGAGKTTLMNVLSTLEKPSHGSLYAMGADATTHDGVKQARKRLGYLPQRFTLMELSSVLRNVRYAGWAHGMRLRDADLSARQAIREVGLEGMESRPVRSLSGGHASTCRYCMCGRYAP